MSNTSPQQALETLVADLVVANHILYVQGVLDGYGHVSVRHPVRRDHFLMSRAVAPGRVAESDILEYDSSANAIDAKGQLVYSERFIHSEVYRARPDVNAVVHSHSPTVIPFSVSTVPLRPISAGASFLYKGVPIYEIRDASGMTNMMVSDETRGRALAQTLGENPVALMRGHGNVVVGPHLRSIVSRAIFTELNAKLQLQAVMLGGGVNYIAPEEGALMEAGRAANSVGFVHGMERVWDLYKEEAERALGHR